MPQGSPRPSPAPGRRYSVMRRFWRIFRLLALLAIVIAALGVVLVARGDPVLHIRMLIATALGIGLTVLLGSGLMVLLFLSSASGHDEAAGTSAHQENDKE
jgi:hypothetical protein